MCLGGVERVRKRLIVLLVVAVARVQTFQVSLGQCPLQVKEPCNTGAIKFVLHTQNGTQILDPFKPKLPNSFNYAASTKIIIHGYSGHLDYGTSMLISAYVAAGRSNVIAVDWGSLSRLPCYPTAALNTWQAGQCAAVFAVSLAALGIDPQGLHVLGFSLGAHVASYASNWIRSTMGVKFGRITGLDPALPFFATPNAEWKLDADDATFVDIVHTNSGIYGKIEPTGHADFYVNGGTFQPGCAQDKNPPLCSHMLGPIYFAESIGSARGFWASSCPGYVQYVLGLCRTEAKSILMGDACDTSTRGVFFLETSSVAPFALGNR